MNEQYGSTKQTHGRYQAWLNYSLLRDKSAVVSIRDQHADVRDLRDLARYIGELADELDGNVQTPAPVVEAPTRRVPRLSEQHRQIISHLDARGHITNVEAQAIYRIRALPRRISDLEANGYEFTRDWRKDPTGQRYVRYLLRNRPTLGVTVDKSRRAA